MRLSPAYLVAYALVGVALLAVLTFVAAPFARTLVEQWARQDVELRSRLVFNSVQGPVSRALADQDTARLTGILEGVARDQRIVAVGVCDETGALRATSEDMPAGFACEQVARSDAETFSNFAQADSRALAASYPIALASGRADLVILNDLSFIGTRSGQAQGYFVAILAGVAILIAAIGALLGAAALRGWFDALRKAIEQARLGPSVQPSVRDSSLITSQIQKMLKDLDVGRSPSEALQTDWTPQALHDLLGDALPGAEVIIVSNREPYIHNRTDEGVDVQTPASGLVSALEPVMRACGGTWIAHGSGTADRETVDKADRIRVPPDDPAYTLRRVWVTEEEQDGYYYGLSNEGLWPLCHIAFVRPVFRDSDWRLYRQINERFADAVAREAQTEDPVVLVQDYHFALAPRMIRERLPKATIITFWHIPWPNAETFGICPWKADILEGLLGSSIIGFHTQFHCNNFFETVDRFIESRIDREQSAVSLGGHETLVRPYPISIAWPPKALAGQPDIATCRAAVRERLGLRVDERIAVGIERFDYTKGILDRIQSIDELLSTHPEWLGHFTFIQVAAPTRSKLPTYAQLQREASVLADEINAKHGRDGWRPVQLIVRHHEPEEVFELFRAADVCIVSSLHDGMNLVAKEFVASRDDDQGVLVLSSFAGASREMSEALIVNPYDGHEMAAALHSALIMPPVEQAERMRLMRNQVRERNVYRWAGRMLMDAARIRQHRRIMALANDLKSDRGKRQVRRASAR